MVSLAKPSDRFLFPHLIPNNRTKRLYSIHYTIKVDLDRETTPSTPKPIHYEIYTLLAYTT